MNKSIFHSKLKIAKVIPILKEGTTLDVNNYRPISLFSVVSKIIKRIVYYHVYSYFNRNNFFYKLQFGFRKNYGINHAVNKLVETVTDAFEQKEFVFLDLSKGFDTINYNILFSKLHYYGIRGCALNWFQSYLSNRLQQVEYRGNLSSPCYLSHGIPQGSILGPLLFFIYENDFQNCLQKGKALMFADDITIFFQHKCLSELTLTANTQLENVKKWRIANKLSLNITKTN